MKGDGSVNEELKLHIKKLQRRATLSLIAVLSTIISIGFGILLLFVPSFIAIIFFVIAVFCIVYLIHSSRTVKKEVKETTYKPVVFNNYKNFTFEQITDIFESLTAKENQLSTSVDVRFYRLNKIFKLRAVLYKTADFNKKEFDSKKDRINKKANKELHISQRADADAVKTMRFNVIFSNTLNDELYRLISKNTNHNLTRVEGIINIAIVGNQIIIPPLYGECDLAQIGRYNGVIEFVQRVLL